MASAVVSKGQITIPAVVRQALRIDEGDRVEFVQMQPGHFELVAATRSVRALKGLFGRRGRAVTVDEMNSAIARRSARAR